MSGGRNDRAQGDWGGGQRWGWTRGFLNPLCLHQFGHQRAARHPPQPAWHGPARPLQPMACPAVVWPQVCAPTALVPGVPLGHACLYQGSQRIFTLSPLTLRACTIKLSGGSMRCSLNHEEAKCRRKRTHLEGPLPTGIQQQSRLWLARYPPAPQSNARSHVHGSPYPVSI